MRLSNAPLRLHKAFMTLTIKNKDARRIWLHVQGLAAAPTGQINLREIIHDLGFVQIDSIRNVTRAHHHILWSRNQNYREPMIWAHLSEDRALFEHFTHDASLIPIEFYPMWQRQFRRLGKQVERYKSFASHTEEDRAHIKARISAEGPLCTRAFDTKTKGPKAMWARPPHKSALDYMWYKGELTTSHRENFVKFYDLTERRISAAHREATTNDEGQIDWLCREALNRLGFGSLGDIRRFWDAVSHAEVKAWADRHQAELRSAHIEAADGSLVSAFMSPAAETLANDAPAPTSRLRIINPFDPAIRDRDRLKRLFGFEYVNEIFVPAAKRRWGYYVYPLLEGDRFVGRTELKADRKNGTLTVHKLWPEPSAVWTQARDDKFYAELHRLGRMIGTPLIIREQTRAQ